MYIDIIVFLVLLLLVGIFFRKLSSVIYFTVIFDITLRVIAEIKELIGISDIKAVLDKYIPSSIPDIASNYIDGIFYNIFMWILVVVYIIFLSYIIKTFWKKRR